ncbi:MAG: ribonuclease III, partial [Microgenomates group bacterium Gr01-1014_93]
NTFEALLGAIFLDLGLSSATNVVHQTLLPDFRKELALGPPKDSKSELQELAQERLKESPHYKIIGTKGPDHAKQFMVGVYIKGREVGRGIGSSKQAAEEVAANQALKKLQ